MSELLLGCGNSREKKVWTEDKKDWTEVTTLDFDPHCEPDIIHDLNDIPLPFDDCEFDEIHAYEMLEHVGQQGDWRFFFDQFSDFYRIIKPNGILVGTCPHYTSPWAFGDPSHTRIVGIEALTFLSQEAYRQQVGRSNMSDFRRHYAADWKIIHQQLTADLTQVFILRAIK